MNIIFKPQTLHISTGTQIARDSGVVQPYEGEYEATPSQQVQVFYTQNLRMTDNFTVNPIPSNYGLVTWNGSVMTIT